MRRTHGTAGTTLWARICRLLGAAIVVGVAAGCAGPPDLGDAAAARLQAAVALVRQASVEGRYPDALAGLDQVEALLDAAVAQDEVSAERSSSIEAALARARAEVTAAQAAVQAAADAQAAADTQAAAEVHAAAEAQAAAEAKAAAEAASGTVSDDEDRGNGRSGNGPGQSGDRGKGND